MRSQGICREMSGGDNTVDSTSCLMICSHIGFTAVDATFKLLEQAVSSVSRDPSDHSTKHYTSHHASYLVYRITLEGLGKDALAQSRSTAASTSIRIRRKSRCLRCRLPLSKGALLADEVGFGKTIEAGLPPPGAGAERKWHILLIVPAALRKQWSQELFRQVLAAAVNPRKPAPTTRPGGKGRRRPSSRTSGPWGSLTALQAVGGAQPSSDLALSWVGR